MWSQGNALSFHLAVKCEHKCCCRFRLVSARAGMAKLWCMRHIWRIGWFEWRIVYL